MKTVWKSERVIANVLAIMTGLLLVAARAHAAGWQVEKVDGGGPGEYSSLKVDKQGNVHLAYVISDAGNYPLRYAFRDHALKRWFVMNLAIAAGFCSLTLDSKDHPHISWADHGTGSGSKLRYIHWDGSSWHPEVLPLNSDVIGYYTSIALDLNDRPSISFYEYRGPVGSDLKDRMRVATWNGDFWEARTVDGTMGGGKFNCLASDALGRVHLAYANVVEQAGMRYALWDGKSWKMEILEGLPEANGYVGVNSCIAIDKNSNPHVTYMDTTKRNVKYGVRQNGRWKLEVVDAVGSVAYPDRNSIVVDDQGRPYIGYFDGVASVLKVAYRQGNQWFTSVVDERGTGFTSSLDIHQGKLWVSYTDQTAGGVRVAQIDLDALRGLHDGNSPSREGSREQTPPAGNPQGR